ILTQSPPVRLDVPFRWVAAVPDIVAFVQVRSPVTVSVPGPVTVPDVRASDPTRRWPRAFAVPVPPPTASWSTVTAPPAANPALDGTWTTPPPTAAPPARV